MKEVLKLALEAMQRIDAFLIRRGYSGLTQHEEEVIAAIEAALAQQEPDHGNDDLTIAYMSGVHRGKELAAQPTQKEPTCPECKAAVLYECVACSSNNYPAQPAQEPWCMKMNGCKTKCEDCPDEPAQELDYAYPTIEDFEEITKFKVNDTFRMGWAMARTTNDLFKQMEKNA